MSDIVERLRADADFIDRDTYDECWEVKETERGKRLREAADAITTLRAENERMREALELIDSSTPYDSFIESVKAILPPTDLAVQKALNAMGNIARAALSDPRALEEQKP
jgi:hypothetical protein